MHLPAKYLFATAGIGIPPILLFTSIPPVSFFLGIGDLKLS